MASLFNSVSINPSRYFFATQLDGEQQLTIDYPVLSGISTTLVGITGSQGNEVQINQMPVIIATEFMEADEGLAVGGASTYWTPSTINTTYAGLSLSTDRAAGSGIACIESYGTNGTTGGFEFLSRGVNATLLSTNNADTNANLVGLGRPGATAVLGGSGTFITATLQGASFNNVQSVAPAGAGCFNIQDLSGATDIKGRWSIGKSGSTSGANAGSDLNIFSYADDGSYLGNYLQMKRSDGATNINFLSSVNAVPYPQNLLSTVFSGTQSNAVTSNTPTVLFTQSDANTSNLIAGQNYLVDIPCSLIELVAVGGSGAYMDVGVRLGGNGSFNYAQSIFISGSGLPAAGISLGFTQIADMGTTNKDIDIVGYLHDANATFRVGANVGGDIGYLKMVT